MPIVRFVREGRDVDCLPGAILRDVALAAGVELYGLKGKLGNCGGCGQCSTCFIEVVGPSRSLPLTPHTETECKLLRRRPQAWRLACQAMVEQSVAVVTRPQTALKERDALVDEALARELPAGTTRAALELARAAEQEALAAAEAPQADQQTE
ncbi:MAG: 2Fe-2S iron-sulfur cluster binding domain-containing protein [Aphanocapsa feldmannii 277cI]|uniref:2Fe-2S iron-sulfur cluster binding domain-containing protein n=1 Tax=Aphanocapsa feldmannii 277cI TaxID=2507554 RepID=A0A524RSI9_9CHRO|nr:MAG: 2Fe-2S iron-sulfur cluster binding domain-containing protein [Aphanocapsa feldmannii 277cI]